jgi:transcription initiation factor TFIID subunit 5
VHALPGYKNAESALRSESKVKTLDVLAEDAKVQANEASIPEFVLFYNEAEANNPTAYEQSYGVIRKW